MGGLLVTLYLWSKLIKGFSNYWSKCHHTDKDDTTAEDADHKSRDQHGTNRLAPVKPIHCFNRHDVQDSRINAYDKTKCTNAYPHNRDAAQQTER